MQPIKPVMEIKVTLFLYYCTLIIAKRFANMRWLGFPSHLPVRSLIFLLNVQTLNKPLNPSLLILAVLVAQPLNLKIFLYYLTVTPLFLE